MIKSRKKYQFQIQQFVLSSDNNPLVWTEEILTKLLKGEVIIGYLFKATKSKFDIMSMILNVYTLPILDIVSQDAIVTFQMLQNVFAHWLDTLKDNKKAMCFQNPPIQEWLNTKVEWCKKIAGKMAARYARDYDECLSSLYMTILKCYNKGNVYIGNLWYVETAADNDLKMDFRYMYNRLTGKHPCAVHLDANPNENSDYSDEKISSFHEIIGSVDLEYNKREIEATINMIMVDLKKSFSDREIDQIINMPNFMSTSLYRRLLAWRKKHKRSDYT